MENQELIKQVTEKAQRWLTPAYEFFLETVHFVVIILEIIAPNVFRKRN